MRLDKRLFAIIILWLKNKSLEASDNLPNPEVIALEIVEDLEAALEQFREIVTDYLAASHQTHDDSRFDFSFDNCMG